MGLLTSVDKRAFHHKLRGHREKPEKVVQMSQQQMQTWDKLASEAKRCVGNLFSSLLEPNEKQAEVIDSDLREIASQIDALRAKLT